MADKIVVVGYGPVGKATAEVLAKEGRDVVVVQRSEPKSLPPGAAFAAADANDREAIQSVTAGASHVVLAIGLPYSGAVWRATWPRVMSAVLDACAANAARLVFADNLYMYGPQTAPLTEDMPLTSYGVKPAVRADITRLWQAAQQAGRVRVAAIRAPDFYGPHVTLSHIGDTGLAAIARGKTATLIIPPDNPHDFAYVPDIARAIATVIAAPDDVYGQAWHVPCAPTETARQILELGAQAIGRPLRLRSMPQWMVSLVGMVVPQLREIAEMRFTFDRPYVVDTSKFARRFWSDATPFSLGVDQTVRSFVATA